METIIIVYRLLVMFDFNCNLFNIKKAFCFKAQNTQHSFDPKIDSSVEICIIQIKTLQFILFFSNEFKLNNVL